LIDVVLLCGGQGTRLYPLSRVVPKPLVPIGGRPILELIIAHLQKFGLRRFVLALGCQGDALRAHFSDPASVERQRADGLAVLPVETGLDTATGGRLKRLEPHLRGDRVILAYGDVLSDVDIDKLLAFHDEQNTLGTVTAVRPVSPFGHLVLDGGRVSGFVEKPRLNEWVNIGYAVLDRKVLQDLRPDSPQLEVGLLAELAERGELSAWQHDGVFEPMDTPADHDRLCRMWDSGELDWIHGK
jgi:glucose-1-phosphate cytidylyltransferase